jgi:hypothetical protein
MAKFLAVQARQVQRKVLRVVGAGPADAGAISLQPEHQACAGMSETSQLP